MSTPNYGFTEIQRNMTADVTRDLNRLANEVDEALKEVENKVPAEASTGGAGVVKLNDTVNSRSKTEAATANAVRVAFERADAAFTQAVNGKTLIVTAINGKGGSVNVNDTYETLATSIAALPIWPDAPGPKQLLHGTMSAGYFGTVPVTELFTADELAGATNFWGGTPHNQNSEWLKFAIDNKIIYRPKKTLRYGVSWSALRAANLVNGTHVITKNNRFYRCRLLKGADANPTTLITASVGLVQPRSEFERLLIPLINEWGIFTADDLNIAYDRDGHANWCMEHTGTNSNAVNRFIRSDGNAHYATVPADYQVTTQGYAPVLEYIAKT